MADHRSRGPVVASDLLDVATPKPAEFADDLPPRGSLLRITTPLTAGHTWDTPHSHLLGSGLRWEAFRGSTKLGRLPHGNKLFEPDDNRHLLKVWVGPVRFNAHYFSADHVEFDVPSDALSSAEEIACVHTFMRWLASIAEANVRLTHEDGLDQVIYAVPEASGDEATLRRDQMRIVDLRHAPFETYRDVTVPAWRFDANNVDQWLQQYEPDDVTGVLCHVHLWDEIESTADESILTAVADSIADEWRTSLAVQYPDRAFGVGVSNEPDDYGPTLVVGVRETT